MGFNSAFKGLRKLINGRKIKKAGLCRARRDWRLSSSNL